MVRIFLYFCLITLSAIFGVVSEVSAKPAGFQELTIKFYCPPGLSIAGTITAQTENGAESISIGGNRSFERKIKASSVSINVHAVANKEHLTVVENPTAAYSGIVGPGAGAGLYNRWEEATEYLNKATSRNIDKTSRGIEGNIEEGSRSIEEAVRSGNVEEVSRSIERTSRGIEENYRNFSTTYNDDVKRAADIIFNGQTYISQGAYSSNSGIKPLIMKVHDVTGEFVGIFRVQILDKNGRILKDVESVFIPDGYLPKLFSFTSQQNLSIRY